MAVPVGRIGENRWVRIAGLVLAVVGAAAIAWIANELDQRGPPPVELLGIWLLIGAAGTTALTAGLIIVSIGFASTPARASKRYRRAMLQRLTAGNLTVPLLFLGWWADDPRGLSAVEGGKILLVLLIPLGYLSGLAAWRLWRRSQRLMAINAVEVMATDPRPPVLYLRSFKDDGAVLLDSEKPRTMAWIHRGLAATTPEQESAVALSSVGPVVAVGRPSEPLPELGAARLYVAHEAWQAEVDRFWTAPP
jgi:hypothetical protein